MVVEVEEGQALMHLYRLCWLCGCSGDDAWRQGQEDARGDASRDGEAEEGDGRQEAGVWVGLLQAEGRESETCEGL